MIFWLRLTVSMQDITVLADGDKDFAFSADDARYRHEDCRN